MNMNKDYGYVWRSDHDEHLEKVLLEANDGESRASFADMDTGENFDIMEREIYELATECVNGERCETVYRFTNVHRAVKHAFYLGFDRGYKYGYGKGPGEINTIPIIYEPVEA